MLRHISLYLNLPQPRYFWFSVVVGRSLVNSFLFSCLTNCPARHIYTYIRNICYRLTDTLSEKESCLDELGVFGRNCIGESQCLLRVAAVRCLSILTPRVCAGLAPMMMMMMMMIMIACLRFGMDLNTCLEGIGVVINACNVNSSFLVRFLSWPQEIRLENLVQIRVRNGMGY